VLNVEASHAYPHFPPFLAEVARVLRPGGHFLYVDFRGHQEISDWETALANAPLRKLSERVINAEVLRSMDKKAAQSLELIGHLPALFRPFGRAFAAVPGTVIYRELERGRNSYRLYNFIKD
jgi:ubiquinone/menaquinone biosynthesis C-methylase UbiE